MQTLSGEYKDAMSRLDTVDRERTQLQQHIAMWQKRAADAVEHGQQVNAAERERFGLVAYFVTTRVSMQYVIRMLLSFS